MIELRLAGCNQAAAFDGLPVAECNSKGKLPVWALTAQSVPTSRLCGRDSGRSIRARTHASDEGCGRCTRLCISGARGPAAGARLGEMEADEDLGVVPARQSRPVTVSSSVTCPS